MRPLVRPRQAGRHGQAGLSLIELLVVLAIAGMVGAVCLPALFTARDAAVFRAEADRFLASVPATAATARSEHRLVTFPGDQATLPEGWRLTGEPLVFLPSGACLGGTLTLEGPTGRSVTKRFDPPRCAPGGQGS